MGRPGEHFKEEVKTMKMTSPDARDINPNLTFIHHSEETCDSEAKKEKRRKAAAKAFKRTFGKECEWFKEQQEDAEEEGTEEQDTVEII